MKHAARVGLDYYEAQGLTPIQAAAIIGGFTVESNLNPYAVGDKNLKDHAYGVGQWRAARWANLQNLAKLKGKSPYDLLMQLEFALWELAHHEVTAGHQLFAAKTIEDAVDAMIGYERPSGWTFKNPRHAHTWKQRLDAAKALL